LKINSIDVRNSCIIHRSIAFICELYYNAKCQQIYTYMTTFIISKFPPPIQSSRWKQMIHSISRNMYTGSSFSTPWTISTFEEKIPLDNDRHDCTPISTVFASSQLDRAPCASFSSRSCYNQTFLLSLASATLTAAQCSLSTQSASTLQLSVSRQTPLTVLHCMEHFVQPSALPAIAKAIISI